MDTPETFKFMRSVVHLVRREETETPIKVNKHGVPQAGQSTYCGTENQLMEAIEFYANLPNADEFVVVIERFKHGESGW